MNSPYTLTPNPAAVLYNNGSMTYVITAPDISHGNGYSSAPWLEYQKWLGVRGNTPNPIPPVDELPPVPTSRKLELLGITPAELKAALETA